MARIILTKEVTGKNPKVVWDNLPEGVDFSVSVKSVSKETGRLIPSKNKAVAVEKILPNGIEEVSQNVFKYVKTGEQYIVNKETNKWVSLMDGQIEFEDTRLEIPETRADYEEILKKYYYSSAHVNETSSEPFETLYKQTYKGIPEGFAEGELRTILDGYFNSTSTSWTQVLEGFCQWQKSKDVNNNIKHWDFFVPIWNDHFTKSLTTIDFGQGSTEANVQKTKEMVDSYFTDQRKDIPSTITEQLEFFSREKVDFTFDEFVDWNYDTYKGYPDNYNAETTKADYFRDDVIKSEVAVWAFAKFYKSTSDQDTRSYTDFKNKLFALSNGESVFNDSLLRLDEDDLIAMASPRREISSFMVWTLSMNEYYLTEPFRESPSKQGFIDWYDNTFKAWPVSTVGEQVVNTRELMDGIPEELIGYDAKQINPYGSDGNAEKISSRDVWSDDFEYAAQVAIIGRTYDISSRESFLKFVDSLRPGFDWETAITTRGNTTEEMYELFFPTKVDFTFTNMQNDISLYKNNVTLEIDNPAQVTSVRVKGTVVVYFSTDINDLRPDRITTYATRAGFKGYTYGDIRTDKLTVNIATDMFKTFEPDTEYFFKLMCRDEKGIEHDVYPTVKKIRTRVDFIGETEIIQSPTSFDDTFGQFTVRLPYHKNAVKYGIWVSDKDTGNHMDVGLLGSVSSKIHSEYRYFSSNTREITVPWCGSYDPSITMKIESAIKLDGDPNESYASHSSIDSMFGYNITVKEFSRPMFKAIPNPSVILTYLDGADPQQSIRNTWRAIPSDLKYIGAGQSIEYRYNWTSVRDDWTRNHIDLVGLESPIIALDKGKTYYIRIETRLKYADNSYFELGVAHDVYEHTVRPKLPPPDKAEDLGFYIPFFILDNPVADYSLFQDWYMRNFNGYPSFMSEGFNTVNNNIVKPNLFDPKVQSLVTSPVPKFVSDSLISYARFWVFQDTREDIEYFTHLGTRYPDHDLLAPYRELEPTKTDDEIWEMYGNPSKVTSSARADTNNGNNVKLTIGNPKNVVWPSTTDTIQFYYSTVADDVSGLNMGMMTSPFVELTREQLFGTGTYQQQETSATINTQDYGLTLNISTQYYFNMVVVDKNGIYYRPYDISSVTTSNVDPMGGNDPMANDPMNDPMASEDEVLPP